MQHNSKISYAEIQDVLNHAKTGVLPPLNISILRNITIEPIEPYLRYSAYNMGFECNTSYGDYDNVFQDAVGGNNKLLNESTCCVIIFLKIEVLSPSITQQFPRLSAEQIQEEIERIDNYVRAVVTGIRSQTNAMILWLGFEMPIYPAFGIIDTQSTMGQIAVIQRLNILVLEILNKCGGSYFIDLSSLIFRIGIERYFDNRYWHIGRAPYTREALSYISSEIFKFIRALKGKNKKCLVLDCDNTLWGGTIGEDGLSGIKLSNNSYPGSSFYEFQQEVVNLYHRGVAVALCSKNNEVDVWEVFRDHPDMILRESHIASAQINWDDKAANIRQIANELNIGLDSIVFMDDSDFEINLVRQLLPEVESILLPIKKAVDYKNILSSCGLFDTIALTQEDRSRGEMYRIEAERKKVKSDFSSVEDYHRSLEMIAEFFVPDLFAIPRVAQLSQKTNQFNFTTQRYSESDIAGIISDCDSDILCLNLRDRFGEYGIVGVAVIDYDCEEEATISTWLMSCRVLGRFIEDVFIREILNMAMRRGVKRILGKYIPTQKNMQVRNLYNELGFSEDSPSVFSYNLSDCSTLRENRFAGEVVSKTSIHNT